MADEDYEGGDAGGDFDVADINEDLVEQEGIATGQEQVPAEREVAQESRALQFLNTHHPECRLDYREHVAQVLPLESYPPDNGGDKRHRSVPYLTLYEKTKIIGFRANQLAQGARPFVPVPDHVTDVLDIARLELDAKRLPFLLKRPMPDGTFEYWRLSDLIII
jgi:DNA-directed RNA polymerase subunit K/omega